MAAASRAHAAGSSYQRLSTLLWCTVAVVAALAVASIPYFLDTAIVVVSLFALLALFILMLAIVEFKRLRGR